MPVEIFYLRGLPTPPYWYCQKFTVWYTAPVGGIEVTLDNVFIEDMIVYVHWTEIHAPTPEQTYTVTIIPTSNGTVSVDKTEAVVRRHCGHHCDICHEVCSGYYHRDYH